MRAGGGPAADGRGGSEGPRAEQHRRNNTREARGKGKTDVFLFLGEKVGRYFLYLLDGDSSKGAAVAALGYRHRRKTVRAWTAARCGKTQLVEGCGLWPPFQLIDLRYLCGSAEREKRMDVYFLLTLYI